MYIEELENEKVGIGKEGPLYSAITKSDSKKTLIGIGARVLFYPTLLYNVVRNKIQSEFHWWDWVDEFVLLGAIPFPTDVPHLKQLGVCGVVTLNEPYETLVPTSLYLAFSDDDNTFPLYNRLKENGIDHLLIPTRDYLFAPSLVDICQAVDFINHKASCGKSTYVHCKAGRGRSTTIVLCYLVKYKEMTPESAYEYVKKIRPRVLLASRQWKAVQQFYYFQLKRYSFACVKIPTPKISAEFEENSMVFVTKTDLEGYQEDYETASTLSNRNMWIDLSLSYRTQVATEAVMSRLSCLWLRYRVNPHVAFGPWRRSR